MAQILLCQFPNSQIENLGAELSLAGHPVVTCPVGTKQDLPDPALVHIAIVDASGGYDGTGQCQTLATDYPDAHLILLATCDPLDAKCRLLTCNNIFIFPFTSNDILRRIKELIELPAHTLQVGELSLDIRAHSVRKGDTVYQLTPKQAKLLRIFMCYPERTLTRRFLMETIWDTKYMGDTRTLDVHVRWIRECIEDDPHAPQYLRTVRGVGYRFGLPPETPPD